MISVIDELGKRVFEEMDYLNETQMQKSLEVCIKRNQMIAVPKIYKETTSRRVLQ